MDVVTTKSGGRNLILGNYRYRMGNVWKTKPLSSIVWRCVLDRKKCTAKCETNLTATVLLSGPTEHTHPPETDAQMKQVKSRIATEVSKAQSFVHVVNEGDEEMEDVSPRAAKRGKGEPSKLTHKKNEERKRGRPIESAYADCEEDVPISKQKRGQSKNQNNSNHVTLITNTSEEYEEKEIDIKEENENKTSNTCQSVKRKNQNTPHGSRGAERRPELVIIQLRYGGFRIYIDSGEKVDDWEILQEEDVFPTLPKAGGGALYYAVSILPRKDCANITEEGPNNCLPTSSANRVSFLVKQNQIMVENEGQKKQPDLDPVQKERESIQGVSSIEDITAQALLHDEITTQTLHNNTIDEADDFDPNEPFSSSLVDNEDSSYTEDSSLLTRDDDQEITKSQSSHAGNLSHKKINLSEPYVPIKRPLITPRIASVQCKTTVQSRGDVGPQVKCQVPHTNSTPSKGNNHPVTAPTQDKKTNYSKQGSQKPRITLTNKSLPSGKRTKRKLFPCMICDRVCRNQFEQSRHREKEHLVDGKILCRRCDCGKVFTSFFGYVRHIKRLSGVGLFYCDLCGRGFPAKTDLSIHLHKHLDAKPHRCETCGFTTSLYQRLKRHQLTHSTERPFMCDVCSASFKTPYSLKKHKMTHTDVRPYSCDTCGLAFRQRTHLKTHVRQVHKIDRCVCSVCGETFTWKGELQKHYAQCHMSANEGENKSLYPDFLHKLASEPPKKRARRQKGTKTIQAPGQHTCRLCDQIFEKNQELLNHLRYVHDAEHLCSSFLCDICGKGFSTSHNMIQHRSIHTGEKKYVCNVCGETYPNKSRLNNHLAFAHDIRKYPCTTCGKRYITYAALVVHRKVHTGERPCVCDICGKSFIRDVNLKAHLKRVHKLSSFGGGQPMRKYNVDGQAVQYHGVTAGQDVQVNHNIDGQQSIQHHNVPGQAFHQHDPGWAVSTGSIQTFI